MRILHIVGARPNFIKVSGVIKALDKYDRIDQKLVHTGQHYNACMSDVFFRQLEIPEPDINLGVGSGTHAHQTAEIIYKLEKVLNELKPETVLVYGDVNSTFAGALCCAKMGIPVGHVEAGLRSFDNTMPEEINRILTDRIADYLFTPSEDADKNLMNEGILSEKIIRVGNVMIDALIKFSEFAEEMNITDKFGLEPNEDYALVTLHRPANVDEMDELFRILKFFEKLSDKLPIMFPVHPRTQKVIDNLPDSLRNSRLKLTEPLEYIDFLALQINSAVVITDSGGIQEETTYLGIPCLTMRKNTERPITVEMGTNTIVGNDLDKINREIEKIVSGKGKKGAVPPLWDGCASERIAEIIVNRK